MAGPMTIEQMRQMIERLDQARELEENIPQAYIDRLEKSSQLLGEFRKLPAIDWASIKTAEEIEKAEFIIHQRLELKNDIERHLVTCGLTVGGGEKRGRKAGAAARQRQPRRSKEQLEFDRRIAEITKTKKEEMGLPARGRISEDDKAKLETALEKEIKKQKLIAPRG